MSIEALAEYVAMSDIDLDAEIRRVELETRALQARRSSLIAVAEARQIHAADGHHSIKGYLRATCNWSNAKIARQRSLARSIDAVPSIADALGAGHIGVPSAMQIARVHANRRIRHLLPAIAPVLLEHAEHLSFDDFKICVDRFIMLADLDGAFDGLAADIEHRTAHVTAVGGGVHVSASGGDPITSATMTAIFERFVQAEFRHDVDARSDEHGDTADQHPLPRSATQRRFDALSAIFDAAAISDGGKAPDPLVNIVCDERTLDEAFTRAGMLLPGGSRLDVDELGAVVADWMHDQITIDPASLLDRRCETSTGIVVPPILAVQAALTGHVRRVVVDSAGVITDLGRKQRLFTGSNRVAAKLLHRRCGHPGCDIAATFADVDHIDGWAADEGRTDQHNADVRCGKHDRFKHRHRWRTRRDPTGRKYSVRPDGTVVLPVGERTPDLTVDELERCVRRRLDELRQHHAEVSAPR